MFFDSIRNVDNTRKRPAASQAARIVGAAVLVGNAKQNHANATMRGVRIAVDVDVSEFE